MRPSCRKQCTFLQEAEQARSRASSSCMLCWMLIANSSAEFRGGAIHCSQLSLCIIVLHHVFFGLLNISLPHATNVAFQLAELKVSKRHLVYRSCVSIEISTEDRREHSNRKASSRYYPQIINRPLPFGWTHHRQKYPPLSHHGGRGQHY